jgi:hypothetical protein
MLKKEKWFPPFTEEKREFIEVFIQLA